MHHTLHENATSSFATTIEVFETAHLPTTLIGIRSIRLLVDQKQTDQMIFDSEGKTVQRKTEFPSSQIQTLFEWQNFAPKSKKIYIGPSIQISSSIGYFYNHGALIKKVYKENSNIIGSINFLYDDHYRLTLIQELADRTVIDWDQLTLERWHKDDDDAWLHSYTIEAFDMEVLNILVHQAMTQRLNYEELYKLPLKKISNSSWSIESSCERLEGSLLCQGYERMSNSDEIIGKYDAEWVQAYSIWEPLQWYETSWLLKAYQKNSWTDQGSAQLSFKQNFNAKNLPSSSNYISQVSVNDHPYTFVEKQEQSYHYDPNNRLKEISCTEKQISNGHTQSRELQFFFNY